MTLNDQFQLETVETKFGTAENIRIRGHRISIEHVLEYTKRGMSPEEIVRDVYPSLTIDEVRNAMTFYDQNREAVDDYIRRGKVIEEAFYQEWLTQEPSPVVKRLRELKAQQERSGAGK